MENSNANSVDPFRKQENKQEMKKQVISFGLMITFTLIAFAVVATDAVPKMFAIPIIVIMAAVQVGFQFYYFMHLKDKDHAMPATMIYGGVWVTLLVMLTFLTITWW